MLWRCLCSTSSTVCLWDNGDLHYSYFDLVILIVSIMDRYAQPFCKVLDLHANLLILIYIVSSFPHKREKNLDKYIIWITTESNTPWITLQTCPISLPQQGCKSSIAKNSTIPSISLPQQATQGQKRNQASHALPLLQNISLDCQLWKARTNKRSNARI